MIRVLVADDQSRGPGALSELLADEPDLEVVAEATTGEAAAADALRLRPDVVLMDLGIAGIGGVEATRRIVREAAADSAGGGDPHDLRPKVLVIESADRGGRVVAAIVAGASGHLVRKATDADIAAGIRAVDAGEEVPPKAPTLTPRQVAVLRVVAEGLTNEQIAERLWVSDSTVRTHLRWAFKRLGVRDRMTAVERARELGEL